jgi:HAD superfamily hydrolase (TIGR01509 family)
MGHRPSQWKILARRAYCDRVELTTVRAVLFDMDGTIVDSDAAVERAWTTWATEHAVEPADALAIAHGSPAERTVARLLPALTPAQVQVAAARQLALQYDDLSDVRALPGAPALLADLDAWSLPWAVVTSADVRLAKARLGAAGINPRVVITVEDVSAGKPDPEGYRLAAERVGVEPAHCLVVEDAEVGLIAGRAAGARTAALRGLPGDLSIADLNQLRTLLASVHSR